MSQEIITAKNVSTALIKEMLQTYEVPMPCVITEDDEVRYKNGIEGYAKILRKERVIKLYVPIRFKKNVDLEWKYHFVNDFNENCHYARAHLDPRDPTFVLYDYFLYYEQRLQRADLQFSAFQFLHNVQLHSWTYGAQILESVPAESAQQ